MGGLHAESTEIEPDPLEEAWKSVGPVVERLANAVKPWSVVELRLAQDQVERVKDWVSQTPRETLATLESGFPSETNTPTQAERLGCLLLIVAAETSRDTSTEDSVWPAVRAVFPEDSPSQKLLFTQGQPSKLLKEMLAAAARRFSFRHVFTPELAQKYFDTVKLQYGFTRRGARRKLHEWLVGLGQPLSVQILLGKDPRHPELASESFQKLWEALQAFRRDRVSSGGVEVILRASPWVRAQWVPELLSQARVKLRSRTPVSTTGAPTGVVESVNLHWQAGGKPRLKLELDHEALRTLTSQTQSHQICAAVDGRLTGRWIRQPNGAWHGSNAVFCEPDTCLPAVNLRPTQLTLSTFEGDVLEEFDLTTLDLHRDVLVFDGDTGHLLDSDQAELRTGKSYVVVADADLLLVGGVERVEWESVGSRRAYRLNTPWSEDACLLLENLEFWRPRVQEEARRPNLRVSLAVRNCESPSLGDEVKLVAEGVPEDTESAVLLLGSRKVKLERHDGTWETSRGVALSPELVFGLEKRRIRLRRYTLVQTVPVKLGFEPRGAAVYERDPSSGGSGRWRRLSEEQSLNIGAEKTQIRLLGVDSRKAPVLYEGRRPVGEIPQRGARLATLSLHAWGSPLVAVEENTRRTMASSVEHHGCVLYIIHNLFRREGKPPIIHLRVPVAPSADHSVWVWSLNPRNPTDLRSIRSEKISVENEGLVWRVGPLPDTHAIGLAFRGGWLGSWWDSTSLTQLLRGELSVRLFALLRWFRIPVLSKSLSYNMQNAVYKAPLDFLRAWLGCQGLPDELAARPCDEGIWGVVRQFLWGWSERPHIVDKMLPLFQDASMSRVPGVDPGMAGVADTCPPLLWAWRSRVSVVEVQRLVRFLRQERLGLEAEAGLWALSRKASVSYETLRNVCTSLEAGDFSRIVLSPSVREVGESADGRAALSVLMLEEAMRSRENYKGQQWDR
jgi:hypothetical protein